MVLRVYSQMKMLSLMQLYAATQSTQANILIDIHMDILLNADYYFDTTFS